MQFLFDVVRVVATENYKFLLQFENGQARVFDMRSYLSKRPFGQLNDIAIFKIIES